MTGEVAWPKDPVLSKLRTTETPVPVGSSVAAF